MIIEKMMKDIYRIEVPLLGNPLKYTNSYCIVGEKRHLLIDTGFHAKECKETIEEAFRQLGISLLDADLFITHLHADHSGLAAELQGDEQRKVYSSKEDGLMINNFKDSSYWAEMAQLFASHGMPLPQEDEHPGRHPGELYKSAKWIDFTFLKDGDRLNAGDYNFTCIWTPGHSPGHLCLYDEKKKVFLSGDHILGDITPVICPEKGLENPLGAYLKSLEKVRNLDIETILTGHRRKVDYVYQRIDELKAHHETRLHEILGILDRFQRPMNAYEIASHMTWRSRCHRWQEYPRQQRWFAAGEAAAHLLYLLEQGKVSEEFSGGRYLFTAKSEKNSDL